MRIAIAGSTGQVGRRLEARLRSRGHEVLGLSRGQGYDLAADGAIEVLVRRLEGAEAVVDVTNLTSQDRDATTSFFSSVARTVGEAAARSGVSRTAVLSIIGVDGIPDDAHYAGKYQQELAYREQAPGLTVIRAAHFHEFARMAVEWGRDGRRTRVRDFPLQPVDLEVVVDVLYDAATGVHDHGDVDVAGPRVERLPDLAARLVRAAGDDLDVAAMAASPELASGACLPGPGAIVAGRSFDEWLRSEYPSAHKDVSDHPSAPHHAIPAKRPR
jgi:uncharacterized protein YbjT (DUF2867 family)